MNLLGIEKIAVGECQVLTVQSLMAHAYEHDHWVIAWSGGKDSTATMTLILYLIISGQIPAPKSVTVMYADTRQELAPLVIGAMAMIEQIKALAKRVDFDLRVQVVTAEMDSRFLVYMLGRGVPPPNNATLRWCTPKIKIEPMQKAIEERVEELRKERVFISDPGDECEPIRTEVKKVLTITGVRVGESAMRDNRISMSCSKDGAECGQGWYQNTLKESLTATLAPIIHWRVCNVWDWLMYFAPHKKYGGWDTQMLAQAYGGDKARENLARTGCNGCPLATKDTALDGVLELFPEEWGYIEPIKELRPIYREMRKLKYRLRKHGERKKDGSFSSNPNRVGPLTMEARQKFFAQIVDVQNRINAEADRLARPRVDFINQDEIDRIQWHWENNIWPERWDGTEPLASEPYREFFYDGTEQINLFGT